MAAAYRKRFASSDPGFLFALTYRDTKSAQSELPDHLHDWEELVYVYRGTGTFFIDGAFYEMREGDLFVLPGNTVHRAFPDSDDPVTSTAVFFASSFCAIDAYPGEPSAGLALFEQSRKRRLYKYELPPQDRPAVIAHLERMQDELASQRFGHRQAVLLTLQLMLLELVRSTSGVGGSAAAGVGRGEPSYGPDWLRDVLRQIDERLAGGDLTLSALARLAAVSPAHLSRVFRERVGLTVTDYVTTKRVARAKELLRQTDETVGAISSQCGFDSLPHFHRMFKRVTGVTPTAYRREPPG